MTIFYIVLIVGLCYATYKIITKFVTKNKLEDIEYKVGKAIGDAEKTKELIDKKRNLRRANRELRISGEREGLKDEIVNLREEIDSLKKDLGKTI